MKAKISVFTIVAFIISGICFLIDAVGQQILRQGANDPQIQMATDSAQAFAAGTDHESLPQAIDAAQSLAPFIIVYSLAGDVVTSTVSIHGSTPVLPAGVLEYTRQHLEDRLTWQPQDGVRIATVVRYFNGKKSGYILVGRSLREVEKREDALLTMVFWMWLGMMVGSATLILLLPLVFKKK